jgi:hypothetical protein
MDAFTINRIQSINPRVSTIWADVFYISCILMKGMTDDTSFARTMYVFQIFVENICKLDWFDKNLLETSEI